MTFLKNYMKIDFGDWLSNYLIFNIHFTKMKLKLALF